MERDLKVEKVKDRPNRKKGVTVELIKAVALQFFNEWGYRGTTVRDICEGIGITAPSMYYYFDSKEKIYINLLQEATQLLSISVSDTMVNSKSGVAKDRMKDVFDAILGIYRSHENHMIFLIKCRYFSEKGLEKVTKLLVEDPGAEMAQKLQDYLAGSQKRRMPKTDPADILLAFDGFVTSYLMHLNQGLIKDTPEQAEKSWELFWQGIA